MIDFPVTLKMTSDWCIMETNRNVLDVNELAQE
jgi:hypothetical protein